MNKYISLRNSTVAPQFSLIDSCDWSAHCQQTGLPNDGSADTTQTITTVCLGGEIYNCTVGQKAIYNRAETLTSADCHGIWGKFQRYLVQKRMSA